MLEQDLFSWSDNLQAEVLREKRVRVYKEQVNFTKLHMLLKTNQITTYLSLHCTDLYMIGHNVSIK